MTTRKIILIALVVGITVGAASAVAFELIRESRDSDRQSSAYQVFERRVHCTTVANTYVKENTDLSENGMSGTSVTLDKVDYSPARNSCVAQLETVTYFKGGALLFTSIRDLLSGETLFTVSSKDQEFDQFQTSQPRFFPRVWDYVMTHASHPTDLEKEWAETEESMESKYPRSTPKDPVPIGPRLNQ